MRMCLEGKMPLCRLRNCALVRAEIRVRSILRAEACSAAHIIWGSASRFGASLPMSNIGRLGMSLASALGAIVLSVLTVAWHYLVRPTFFFDGQYGLVFVFTIPLGGILGWAFAASNSNTRWHSLVGLSLCLVIELWLLYPLSGFRRNWLSMAPAIILAIIIGILCIVRLYGSSDPNAP